MPGLFPALFSYNSSSSSSTQYIIAHDRHSYRMCVIKRHVTPKWFPWRGGVRACATGSCAISTLLWPFHRKWRHQTSRDPECFHWKSPVCACAIGSALGVLSRTSGSYNLIIFYELALSLVICPFPAILFSWGVPSIITQPFCRLFSDMFEVLCSTPRVFSITSAFSLWYFY
jgi:hypothetical protein